MLQDIIPDIHSMQLHEIINVYNDHDLATTILRVHGGWIYRTYDKGNQMLSTTFVPYNE